MNVRMPQGSVPEPCPVCDGNVVGATASKRYRKEAVFVHVYEDRACTKWTSTTVYHSDCWTGLSATLGYEILTQEEVDAERAQLVDA